MKLTGAYPYVLERAYNAAEFAFAGDVRRQSWFYRRASQQYELVNFRLALAKLRPLATIRAELEAIEKGTVWKEEVLPAIMRSWKLLHEGRRRGEPVYAATIYGPKPVEALAVRDWLYSLDSDWVEKKLPKVTWAQAVEHARKWHDQLAKNRLIGVAGDKGTARVCEALDGWYWVKLTTTGALDREGEVMGHCVGRGGYDELIRADDAYSGIYSLRDADGRSHVTVEVGHRGGRAWIEQVRGQGNTNPTLEMTRHFGALDYQLASVTGLAHWPAGYLRDLRSYDIYRDDDLPTGAVLEELSTSVQSLHKLPSAISVNGDMFVRPNYFFAPGPKDSRLPRGLIVQGDLRCPEMLLPLPDDVLVCGKVISIE